MSLFDEEGENAVSNGSNAKQALFSIEHYGDIRYFKANEYTVDDIMKSAIGENPFMKLMGMGELISVEEYTEIQQSDSFTYSVEIDFDNDSASIYEVNGGKGGIAEGDRTDENTSIATIKVSDYGEKQDKNVDTYSSFSGDAESSFKDNIDEYLQPTEQINENKDFFRIYQIKSGEAYHGIRFSSYAENQGVDLNHEDVMKHMRIRMDLSQPK